MQNTMPLLSRTPAPAPSNRPSTFETPHVSSVPTIRLTIATPSAANSSLITAPSTTTVLAPKAQLGPRKRLVPKKSKLSLLVGSKRGEKGKDLSDVARRVGMTSLSTGRSFDIFVDPADDPDIGEIVVLKKKKSRAGLDGVRWGALGDVTNASNEAEVETVMEKSEPVPAPLKSKKEEKEKWWTIGRGRKEEKEKTKEKTKGKENMKEASKDNVKPNAKKPLRVRRSTPPEQTKLADPRQRSQSFDAGMLFDASAASTSPFSNFVSIPLPDEEDSLRRTHARTNTSPSIFGPHSGSPTGDGMPPFEDSNKLPNGSIALRAMRSVRSLARIGSWAQLKNFPSETGESSTEDKKPEKKKKKERTRSMRLSRSSFEILKGGFGTVRKGADLTGTVRTVSSQVAAKPSSATDENENSARRHSESSAASSVKTTNSGGSTIEPIIGREPKHSSASSIHWDDQTATIKERRSPGSVSASSSKKYHDNKRTAEGRRRPGLASLFSDPDTSGNLTDSETAAQDRHRSNLPVLTLETASPVCEQGSPTTPLERSPTGSTGTPVKKARPRPLSEQLIGRARPAGIIGDTDGVIQILDAATSDLACLINRLDLETTPNATPHRRNSKAVEAVRARLDSMTVQNSVKKSMKPLSAERSIGPLRSYAQSSGKVPSPTVDLEQRSPVFHRKPEQLCTPMSPPATFEAPFETTFVFHPLPASKAKLSPGSRESSASVSSTKEASFPDLASFIAASSLTFGERSVKTTCGTRTEGMRSKGSRGSSATSHKVSTSSNNMHMSSTAKLNYEDPNSDIPRELRLLLRRNFDRDSMHSGLSNGGSSIGYSSTVYPLPASPGTPPSVPLPPIQPVEHSWMLEQPVFRAPSFVNEDYDTEIEEKLDALDDETKKSFDFTAELKKLNVVGAPGSQSFVTQLEDAFKTPTRYGIHDLAANLGFKNGDTKPDVPPIPTEYSLSADLAQSAPISLPASPSKSDHASEISFASDDSIVSEMSGPDASHDEDLCMRQPLQPLRTASSKPSRGYLNTQFRFGGKRTPAEELSIYSSTKPLTLSDIVPPPSHHTRNQSFSSASSFEKPFTLSDIIPPSHHSRNQSFSSAAEAEKSMLKSVFTKETELSKLSSPASSVRAVSNSNDARLDALAQLTAHSKQNSDVSFSGLSSFSEIRRNFEFGTSCNAFYPPPKTAPGSLLVPDMHWRESLLSLASVSSYGHVLQPGSNDPFDFGVPVSARPISDDMSFTVDDTFSFIRKDHGRQRVDSDASDYSFHASAQNSTNAQQRRSRRQVDSMISVASGPPISLYNRGFSYYGHRWNDSNNSINSFGAYGANSSRVKRRQQTFSVDSANSDFSAQRLGRPNVGDKMFESARDYGLPLSAISASPAQIESSAYQTTFDSIMDEDRDSLFEKENRRSSTSSESVFGYDSGRGLMPPVQFRPVSAYSGNSGYSPKREDDTMISMLGGGYVRRRSIGSTFEGSPCVRAEKRRHRRCVGRALARIPSDDDYGYFVESSSDKARIIENLSFTQTYDEQLDSDRKSQPGLEERPPEIRNSGYEYQFGGDRMSLARKGLLERQSLENCCLRAEGEDTSASKHSLNVFRRPEPVSRSRSGPCGQGHSGVDTPPLSICDTSSQSSGSQCSIDLARLNTLISKSTDSLSGSEKVRVRARGHGHRRRNSEARASRTSIYETIEEEIPESVEASSLTDGNLKSSMGPSVDYQSYRAPVPDIKVVQWDNEDVEPALRKYHALEHEARQIVNASQRTWEDTPFSLYAIQSGIQALLEHSRKTYGHLPSELRGCHRRTRTRTLSRPSPYPRNRLQPADETRPPVATNIPSFNFVVQDLHPLKDVTINSNLSANANALSPVPALNPFKPFTPFSVEFKEKRQAPLANKTGLSVKPQLSSVRSRVLSNARKNGSDGTTNHNPGKTPRKAKENKENAAHGSMTKPAETLRIVRPRPRGRPALAAPRAIRV